ncbi:HNH endonuclease [Adhaeribacter aquaticus]|uniref:HNH endonuclease n=1 Tax=Adhaeribacter aquaticus TaxID=299567 RepID=UPI0004083630|nr:HNH endonuclease [Adhaeribacter aquaticus]
MQEEQKQVLTPEIPERQERLVFFALPFKKLKLKYPWQNRVIFFDPTEIYRRLPINLYQRLQTHMAFKDMFPDRKDGFCSCGCGEPLSGRRRRWVSDDCSKFALAVWGIIDGQVGHIEYYVAKYNQRVCAICRARRDLKVDHIVPVKHGGGGCWLSNFQLLCHTCHVSKTNKDFGWKQKKAEKPIKVKT